MLQRLCAHRCDAMTEPWAFRVAPAALQGCAPKQYRQQYEEKLRAAEMEAIQDYIAENDNLVTLHKEVRAAFPAPRMCTPARWAALLQQKY